MDLSEQSLQQSLEHVYDAAEHPARWKAVCEHLRAVLGVASIHLQALDKRHGTLSYSDGANLPVEGELAYIRRYRFIDPRLPALLQSEPGSWVHCHEVVPEDVAATHPYYRDFLLPQGRRFSSRTKLVDTADATVVLGTLTTQEQGPLSAQQLAWLDRLLPHLQRACRIGLQHFVYSGQALVGHLLVNRLRHPVLLMTPGGQVLHANAAMGQLLRNTTTVQVIEGRMLLPQAHLDDLLRQCAALEEELKTAGDEAGADPAFRLLQVRARGRHEPLYAFFTLLAHGEQGAFGLRPAVLLVFWQPSAATPVDTGLLGAMFGLTPAEARIASLLAEGLSLKEIAEQQGTQHETVRKQLRSIYLKTDTNRQPDLVRLLSHLPHMAVYG